MEVLESPSSAPEAQEAAYPRYLSEYGERVLANGWPIVPIAPGSKRPWIKGWQKTTPETARADLPGWIAKHENAGIGLLTGELVGIDLDVDDTAHIAALQRIVFEGLGETQFTRIGRAPRVMLVYRASATIAPRKRHPIELIELGGQFVALHVHPDTSRTYEWPDKDPIHHQFDEVPIVDRAALARVFDALVAYCGQHALLKSKRGAPDADQSSLPLQGAAPSTVVDPNATVDGLSAPKPRPERKGGRVASEGWREKLRQCATAGNTDRITGECAASYAATTPLHVLDDEDFAAAALDAAKANGLDLSLRGRRSKFSRRAVARGIRSAIDRHQWSRMPALGAPIARVSLDEAGQKLSRELRAFGETAADWAGLRADLTAKLHAFAEASRPAPAAPAGYVPPVTYAPGQRVSKLEREVDERARWALANGSTLAWVKYEDAVKRRAELIESDVLGTIDHLRAPLLYAFSTQGVGKTEHAIGTLMAFLLRWRHRRMPRIVWGTEAHDLLGPTRDRILRAIDDALLDPRLTERQQRMLDWARQHVFHVRSSAHPGACADEARAPLHRAFSDTSVSRTRAICQSCPLKQACDTFKVNVLAPDAPGVFLLPVVHWSYDGGKYDITNADFAVLDEDVGALKQVVLTEQTLEGTPVAPLIGALGKAAVNGSSPGVVVEQELPGDALVLAIADHRQTNASEALIGWRRELDEQAVKLTSRIEALLGENKQKKAQDLLEPLHKATRLTAFVEALLGWHAARGRPSVRLPAFLRADTKSWSVVIQQEKPGLRRTWLTPVLALNGTPRVSETIKSMGAWAKERPTKVVGDQVSPGEGVTHVAVCTDYIAKSKFGDAGQQAKSKTSFAYALERLNALLLIIAGSSLVISQMAGKEAMAAIGLADRVASWMMALGHPVDDDTIGRLHFGNQRGRDEFRNVGALLAVGQNLPSVGACELSAAARALPYAGATSSGKYELVPVPVECADGAFATAYSWRHTDPAAEAERSRIVTDEVAQAVHRGRTVRRGVDSPHLLVTVGTEYGTCGVPVDKFLRLVDVYGIRDIDLVAALGVVPITPAALVRSTFGSFWCSTPGISTAIKAAAAGIEKNSVIPDLQSLVNSAYALEHVFGSWRPGQTWLATPTWGVFEARPEPINPHTGAYSNKGPEISTHLHGGLASASPDVTTWGQRGPKSRWLVKVTGTNAHTDPRAAIETVNGPVRDLVQVGTLRPQLSDAKRHALGRLALGTLPRNAVTA